MRKNTILIAMIVAILLPHLSMADNADAPKEESNNLSMYSLIALSAVQAAANEDGLVRAVQYFRPGSSRNRIRAIYLGLLVSATTGGHFLTWHLTPWMRPDYSRLAWNIGEFVTAYYVSYLYFHQPVVPGQVN